MNIMRAAGSPETAAINLYFYRLTFFSGQQLIPFARQLLTQSLDTQPPALLSQSHPTGRVERASCFSQAQFIIVFNVQGEVW